MQEKDEGKEAAHSFYRKTLQIIREGDVRCMLGGAFALFHYAGIYRDTKDLDIFCNVHDYPSLLKLFTEKGYTTELTDSRWLAKVFDGEYFVDIIFNTPNNICRVDDSWFCHAVRAEVLDEEVLLLPPEELIWCKTYVQSRYRYDGADIQHILLKCGKRLDWKRLLSRLDQHWHLLLANLILFQFIYPADYREIIPEWLLQELLRRVQQQYEVPPPTRAVCLGPLVDQQQYDIDIREWSYKINTI
ncbi:hypothetical protein [Compostibacter hankyongensis]